MLDVRKKQTKSSPEVDKGFVAQVADVSSGRTALMNELQRMEADKTIVGEFSYVKHVRETTERRGYNKTISDQAIHLDLIAKAKGIAAAEEYFINLPELSKNHLTTDSSDEEYFEEEEDTRINRNWTNQSSPTSSSLSNNRRRLRTFWSSPVLRVAADEMFGVLIPRRAHSSSTKRLHEYCSLTSGAFAEELSHQRFSPSSATVSLIGSGSASPSSSEIQRP